MKKSASLKHKEERRAWQIIKYIESQYQMVDIYTVNNISPFTQSFREKPDQLCCKEKNKNGKALNFVLYTPLMSLLRSSYTYLTFCWVIILQKGKVDTSQIGHEFRITKLCGACCSPTTGYQILTSRSYSLRERGIVTCVNLACPKKSATKNNWQDQQKRASPKHSGCGVTTTYLVVSLLRQYSANNAQRESIKHFKKSPYYKFTNMQRWEWSLVSIREGEISNLQICKEASTYSFRIRSGKESH